MDRELQLRNERQRLRAESRLHRDLGTFVARHSAAQVAALATHIENRELQFEQTLRRLRSRRVFRIVALVDRIMRGVRRRLNRAERPSANSSPSPQSGHDAPALADQIEQELRKREQSVDGISPDGGVAAALRLMTVLSLLEQEDSAEAVAESLLHAYPGVITPELTASLLSELRARGLKGPARTLLASALRRWPNHAWIRFEAAAYTDLVGSVPERMARWSEVLEVVTDGDVPTIRSTALNALAALKDHPQTMAASALDPMDIAQYRKWIRANEDHSRAAFDRWSEGFQRAATEPSFSITMPVYNPNVGFLAEALESITEQWYPRWELILSDDGSHNSWFDDVRIARLLEDSRIRVVFRERNGGIAAATNTAIEAANSEWIVFMDQDDLLSPDALARVAEEIVRDPGVHLLYSDEDSIDEFGERFMPYFKPRAVRELLMGQNAVSHLSIFRRDVVMAVGGLRDDFDGSQDWDLTLRVVEELRDSEIVHIPHVLYHWRKTSDTFSASTETLAKTYGAGLRAVRDAVQRRGFSAEISPVAHGSWVQVALRPTRPEPYASIIIPTRDHPDLLIPCVESVLFSTRYEPFEIIIMDNGTRDPNALRFLDNVGQRSDVTVVPWDEPFNFSELLNEGVRRARGEIVVSLNNDVIVYQEDWLAQLVANAQREDVGAVGARLLYADRHVQHAGVLLGVDGVAGHSFAGLGPSDPGYFGQAILNREVEAVTAAAMAVQRSVFLEHGGFDQHNLPVAFNDVDFCLRLRRSGLRNLYLASVELTHLESRSRGRDDRPDRREGFAREVDYMMRTWGREGGDLIDTIKNPNFLQRTGDRFLPGEDA